MLAHMWIGNQLGIYASFLLDSARVSHNARRSPAGRVVDTGTNARRRGQAGRGRGRDGPGRAGLGATGRRRFRRPPARYSWITEPPECGDIFGDFFDPEILTIRGCHNRIIATTVVYRATNIKGPFSRTRSQDLLICGGFHYFPKKVDDFFSRYV